MDNPSTLLILPLYTLISICEKALFFNEKSLDKMRRKLPEEPGSRVKALLGTITKKAL